jgi:hypothetical protein
MLFLVLTEIFMFLQTLDLFNRLRESIIWAKLFLRDLYKKNGHTKAAVLFNSEWSSDYSFRLTSTSS